MNASRQPPGDAQRGAPPQPPERIAAPQARSNAPWRERLAEGARTLGVPLDDAALERCERLLDELARWNRAYNLTAIVDRDEQLTHHLLDSLAIAPFLHGSRIVDVGTGAGFPGLPLAIAEPQREFLLVDSVAKKIRFVSHAAHVLALRNVAAQHARIEALRPAAPFDSVVARAFASLVELLRLTEHLCAPGARVLALKGREPTEEIDALRETEWEVESLRALDIPGLGEQRHLVTLVRRR